MRLLVFAFSAAKAQRSGEQKLGDKNLATQNFDSLDTETLRSALEDYLKAEEHFRLAGVQVTRFVRTMDAHPDTLRYTNGGSRVGFVELAASLNEKSLALGALREKIVTTLTRKEIQAERSHSQDRRPNRRRS